MSLCKKLKGYYFEIVFLEKKCVTQIWFNLTKHAAVFDNFGPETVTFRIKDRWHDMPYAWPVPGSSRPFIFKHFLELGDPRGLTSVASAATTWHTSTPAAPKATVGLPELLTGLPSMAPEHQWPAPLADRSAVIPTSTSTCQQAQHMFDVMWASVHWKSVSVNRQWRTSLSTQKALSRTY